MPSAHALKRILPSVCRGIVTAIWMLALFSPDSVLVAAQSSSIPSDSSPWQRWLPPPKTLAPDAQARLLARLRDMVLSSDPNDSSNQSPLSAAEVKSLKEAMRMFGGNLPEGLSPESLDAIPTEFISRALANPELRRQAKEMAEQYLKPGSSIPSAEPSKSGGSPTRNPFDRKASDRSPSEKGASDTDLGQPTNTKENNKPRSQAKTQVPSPFPSDTDTKLNASGIAPSDQKQMDSTRTPGESKSPDYKELMDKLLKTQEQFERNKNESSSREESISNSKLDELLKEYNEPSAKVTTQEDDWSSLLPTESTKSNPSNKSKPTTPSSGATTPSSLPPEDTKSKNNPTKTTPRSSPSNSSKTKPSPSPATPPRTQKQENNFNQRPSASEPNRLPPTDANRGIGNSGSNGSPSTQQPNRSNSETNNRNKAIDSSLSDSKDIRKELDKKGLGPTLQKMIDDARANIAKRPAPNESKLTESAKNSVPIKEDARKSSDTALRSGQASQSPLANRSPETARSNPVSQPQQPSKPQPDTEISKGLKQASTYLNNLWAQISKPTSSTSIERASPNLQSDSQSDSSAASNALSLLDPLNSQLLFCLGAIAIVGLATLFAMRYQVQTAQERRETIRSQLVARIEEIRTREDLVRAFHALAHQRLKAAQSWWTNGQVTQQFEIALPEHKTTVQTLSRLYDQARYYPNEYQFTDQQIDEAKLALKQCKG